MKRKKTNEHYFVVCINNEDYPASLECKKIYEAIPDGKAAKQDFVRIIDESGEDYLYPNSCFIPIHLTKTIEKALSLLS